MKIMLINPDSGMEATVLSARCQLLKEYVGADVELAMVCPTLNNLELDSALDAALAGPELLCLVKQAEQENYDAVVLYCFSDPVLAAARELVKIPVVGAGQAACLLAPVLGRQAGLLLADDLRIAEKRDFILQTGVRPDCIPVVAGIAGREMDMWQNREQVLELLQAAGQEMLAKQQIQVIILGCLSFLGLAQPLTKLLGVPVIDPAIAAVSLAESLVRQKLSTSTLAYPAPLCKARTWSGGSL